MTTLAWTLIAIVILLGLVFLAARLLFREPIRDLYEDEFPELKPQPHPNANTLQHEAQGGTG